jgi:adenosylmethionine-8-amino-7-oxononanoate aminotransferase
MGAIGVVELDAPVSVAALSAAFAERGVWIRPMGKVVYLTPPLVTDRADLAALTNAVAQAVRQWPQNAAPMAPELVKY